jgi:hypothetical protein
MFCTTVLNNEYPSDVISLVLKKLYDRNIVTLQRLHEALHDTPTLISLKLGSCIEQTLLGALEPGLNN